VYYYCATHRPCSSRRRRKSRCTIPPPYRIRKHPPPAPLQPRRSTLAVSHERSCAYLRPAPSICASHTRTMSPVSSHCAAAVAPSARPKTLPLSRTGSAEQAWDRKSGNMQLEHVCNYTSGSTPAWESENDWPIAELIADMYQALDRLECSSAGDKSSSRRLIPVRQHCFAWSLISNFGARLPHTPCQLLFNSFIPGLTSNNYSAA
jgi:hypothetical protein